MRQNHIVSIVAESGQWEYIASIIDKAKGLFTPQMSKPQKYGIIYIMSDVNPDKLEEIIEIAKPLLSAGVSTKSRNAEMIVKVIARAVDKPPTLMFQNIYFLLKEDCSTMNRSQQWLKSIMIDTLKKNPLLYLESIQNRGVLRKARGFRQ